MARLLITGARSPVTLDLARLLHSGGNEIYVADTAARHLTGYSNAVKKSFQIPSPRFQLNSFKDKLSEIIKNESIEMLIPTCEEILFISKIMDQLPRSCLVFSEPHSMIESLHNKWTFIQKVKEAGLPAPRTHLLQSIDELDRSPIQKPFVIKASYSRASQSIIKVDNGDWLPDLKIEPHNPWIIQEYLGGKKYCTYSIAQKGKLKAHAVYPVQYAIDCSSCLTFESIEHPGIYDWIEKFVRYYNFTGQIAFDFIENEDGTIYPIECNPRATSGVHLFSQKDHLEQAFFNENEALIVPQDKKPRQFAAGMVLYGWKFSPANKKKHSFLADLFHFKDVIFSSNDLKPFLMQPLLCIQYILQSKMLKKPLPAAFTHDIDWNGDLQ